MCAVSIDNAEHYTWGDQCDGWHLARSPKLSVIQERVPAGCGERQHLHRQAEQFFYVLSGVASLKLADASHTLTAGQGLHVPAGTPHSLVNNHADELRFLVVSTPPSHGDKVELS